MKKEQIMMLLITVGMLLIAVGIVLPIFMGIDCAAYRYIYAAGALMLIIGRIFSPYRGKDLRLKRLYRIESWSAIFFCVAAFMLFYNPRSMRDALAFTLAGGVIQVYTSIMIPRRAKKAGEY